MKKLYILAVVLAGLSCGKSFSQTFTYTLDDTIGYAAPGAMISLENSIINSTLNIITIDAVRTVDVMPDCPTWTTMFCLDVCYPPFVDSVRFDLPADSIQSFVFDFTTDATADSGTAIMKVKNVSTPSNTFYQKFYGITIDGFAVNESEVSPANVSFYPMPVASNETFVMNVTNVKYGTGKNISMLVFNMYGNLVAKKKVIAGTNFMYLDLPAGFYSYSLITEDKVINTGKIAVGQ